MDSNNKLSRSLFMFHIALDHVSWGSVCLINGVVLKNRCYNMLSPKVWEGFLMTIWQNYFSLLQTNVTILLLLQKDKQKTRRFLFDQKCTSICLNKMKQCFFEDKYFEFKIDIIKNLKNQVESWHENNKRPLLKSLNANNYLMNNKLELTSAKV